MAIAEFGLLLLDLQARLPTLVVFLSRALSAVVL